MKKNSHFLKTILTTASTFALTLGSTVEVQAAQTPVVFGTTSNSNTGMQSWNNGQSQTATFINGSSVRLEQPGHNISLNSVSNAAPIVAAIDLNGLSPTGQIEVSDNNTQLGSIGNGQGNTMQLQVDDGISFTLTGTPSIAGVPGTPGGNPTVGVNDYSGLGAVTLGSSNGGGSTLNITPTTPGAITFTNSFDSNAASVNYAVMNLSGGNHVFNGEIGSNKKLDYMMVTDGSAITLGKNTTANAIKLANVDAKVILRGGTISANIQNTSTHSGTTFVEINGGDVILAGSVGASGATLGSLNFVTDNTLTIDATAGARSIYAPITTATDSNGTFVIKPKLPKVIYVTLRFKS